jgi:hypothetical protein
MTPSAEKTKQVTNVKVTCRNRITIVARHASDALAPLNTASSVVGLSLPVLPQKPRYFSRLASTKRRIGSLKEVTRITCGLVLFTDDEDEGCHAEAQDTFRTDPAQGRREEDYGRIRIDGRTRRA